MTRSQRDELATLAWKARSVACFKASQASTLRLLVKQAKQALETA
jgi:hypothetical protein